MSELTGEYSSAACGSDERQRGGLVTAIVGTGHGTDTTISAEVCHVG